MVQVPLPQEALQGGSLGGFTAPRVLPGQSAVGTQIQQLGRGLETAGAAAADIANVLQNDLDNATTTEAYTLWNQEIRDALNDPETGYLNRKGKDATGEGRATVQDLIAERAEAISGELDNDVQRGMFQQISQRRISEVTQQMDRHEAGQIRVYRLGEAKAMVESAAGDAIEAITIGDIETFQIHRNNAIAQTKVVAEGLGFGPEQTEGMILETTTAIHSGVVQRLVSEDRADEARSYLEGVDKDEIDQSQQVRLNNLVQRASINDRATTMALDLVDEIDARIAAQAAEPPIEGEEPVKADELDLLQQAQAALDTRFREGTISAEMRDAVSDRIQETASQRRDVRINDIRETLTQAESWLVDNPNAGVRSLPPDLHEDLREAGQLGAIAGFADGRRYTTDPQVYARVLNTDPEVLRQMTPGEFFLAMRPHLADQELNDVTALHERATQGAGARAPKGLITDPQRFKEEAARLGIIDRTGRLTEREAIQLFRFKEMVDQRAKEAERLGQPMDVKAIAEDLRVDQAFVEQSFFGVDFVNPDDLMPIATMTAEQEERAFVRVEGEIVRLADIPGPRPGNPFEGSVRGLIVSELRRQGLPITQQAIAEVWVTQGKPQDVRQASEFETERRGQRRRRVEQLFGDEPTLFGIDARIETPPTEVDRRRFPGLGRFLLGRQTGLGPQRGQ